MKTRNIITIICIFASMMFASCSSENDVLDEMGKMDVPAENGVLTSISCNINGIATKAMVNVAQEEIKSAMFLLTKGTTILTSVRKEQTIYTKNQTGLQIIAVANASEATYLALEKLTNVADIYTQVLAEADLQALVKISEPTSVNFDSATATTANVNVDVKQVAARIDLSLLQVAIKSADSPSVLLESVEFVNQNTAGVLNSTPASSATYENETTPVNQSIANGSSLTDVCSFYSFANESSAHKTTLRLNLVIDGKSKSCEFTIKHDGAEKVVAGCNYQLKISLTVMGENVEPVVTFTVADWNNSSVSGEMVDSTDK